MSTIEVENISDKTTSVPAGYVVNGSAKAWCNLNGTGTIAVADSLNTSSVTDVGTGSYTNNFTNSFLAADMATVFGMGFGAGAIGTLQGTYSTSQVSYVTIRTDTNGVADMSLVCSKFTGALA